MVGHEIESEAGFPSLVIPADYEIENEAVFPATDSVLYFEL